jgi:hypothetical protein
MSKRSDDVKEPYFGTWEHVTPRSRGGKKGGNRVVACRACNRLRGNTILPLFLAEHPIIGLYSLCGHPWVEEQIREGYMPKVDRYHTLTVA